MKIVSIVGSPRLEANSRKISQSLIAKIPGTNHIVTEYLLNNLKIKGCQACGSCKGKTESCVVVDDLTQVLAKVKEADLILLGSPVYMTDITAQMKIFIDRSYSFLTPEFQTGPVRSRLAPEKKILWIFTQGNPDLNAYEELVFSKYKSYFEHQGINVKAVKVYCPPEAGEEHPTFKAAIAEGEQILRDFF
ncbi:MAG: flavodoxin family protein [Deltaproteobacteria bacterium]|jgi:multimeric flavodoxin WrbA|nr:flavodoxin family protein [Deltaproteobacteria bacterium]